MKEVIKEDSGIVAELNGQYWGIQYQDSHSTSYGFGPIENAVISDSEYCTKPEDLTYRTDRHLAELQKAKLVTLVKTTIYRIQEDLLIIQTHDKDTRNLPRSFGVYGGSVPGLDQYKK